MEREALRTLQEPLKQAYRDDPEMAVVTLEAEGRLGEGMRWDYDFGDGWEHDVLVEAISLPDRGVEYPRCVTGRRACPPEDCGGPWGYAELLEVLKDPSHPEHETMKEWAPIDFDPARFDTGEITEAMRRGPVVWEDD